jgi:DNA-binding NarL/FixJ family response regulator
MTHPRKKLPQLRDGRLEQEALSSKGMSFVKAASLRLLLVDDHRLVLDGLSAVLLTDPSIDCVETATCAREALEKCESTRPHVVLLDLRMPGDDGITILNLLKQRWPDLRVLILSGSATRADVSLARSSGAMGVLDKSVQRTDLLNAIQSIAAGVMVFPPSHRDHVHDGVALTGRELEVLQHLARGLHNEELAQALGIGVETIKTHLRTIFSKLDVASRTEAVARAHALGLVGR